MARKQNTKSEAAPITRAPKGKKNAASQQETTSQDAPPADPPAEQQLAHVEAVAPATAGKRTIEKEREERNGVKRPSAGGLCRAVWDFVEAGIAKGAAPSVKEVKAEAEARGWNPNNASIEYYQARKFHGIRGRTAAPKVEAAAPTAEA